MKKIGLIGAFLGMSFFVIAQEDTTKNIHISKQIVEASCGQCNFEMKGGKGCDLAVKIEGKSYFVDGSDIDDHGDSHGKDGMCMAIKKAEVEGQIIDGRFKAKYFKVLPNEEKK